MAAPMDEKITCQERNDTLSTKTSPNKRFKGWAGLNFLCLLEMVLFSGMASISLLAGFGFAFSRAKKQDSYFAQGAAIAGQKMESPSGLATRALAWGTLISVTGVGLMCFGIYKLSGTKNLKDFSQKMQEKTPNFPKKEPTGRNEFGSIREFVDYCIKGGKG